MERDKLKALERAAESGFTLQSGAQLQEWLEKFAATVKDRAHELRSKVDKLVDHTSSVEQELHNTFNTFRLLSNTQFIENRVYEEDETVIPLQRGGDTQQRLESYEDDIVPRYREAASLAWNAHQQALTSASIRETKQKPLPYLIGTEEFMRDPSCGLSDFHHAPSASNAREYDSEAESGMARMASQMVGGGVVSENEWSEPNSEFSQEKDNNEPAVTAALDFKAMLEAALRGSYIPYSDGMNQGSPPSLSDSGAGLEDAVGKEGHLVETEEQSRRKRDENEAAFKDILGQISREAGQISRRSFDGSSSWSSASDEESREKELQAAAESHGKEQIQVQPAENTSTYPKVADKPSSRSGEMWQSASGKASSSVPTCLKEDLSDAFADELPQSGTVDDKTSSSGSDAGNEEFQQSVAERTLPPKSLALDRLEKPKQPEQPAGTLKSSTLSNLLFGDGDEDEDEAEVALFGPVRKTGS